MELLKLLAVFVVIMAVVLLKFGLRNTIIAGVACTIVLFKIPLITALELALQRLSGDRRLVCMIAPVVIGFLLSAGAVNICGKIVDDTIGDDLTVGEKTFVTSYYRHISESFSPTYNSILLALSITGVIVGSFVLCMIPMVVLLIWLGYRFYLKKIDKNYKNPKENYDKKEELFLTQLYL